MNNEKQKKLFKLIDDLYWEYDRMSSSGKETLDKIAELIKLPKPKITKEELIKMGCPLNQVHLYMENDDDTNTSN